MKSMPKEWTTVGRTKRVTRLDVLDGGWIGSTDQVDIRIHRRGFNHPPKDCQRLDHWFRLLKASYNLCVDLRSELLYVPDNDSQPNSRKMRLWIFRVIWSFAQTFMRKWSRMKWGNCWRLNFVFVLKGTGKGASQFYKVRFGKLVAVTRLNMMARTHPWWKRILLDIVFTFRSKISSTHCEIFCPNKLRYLRRGTSLDHAQRFWLVSHRPWQINLVINFGILVRWGIFRCRPPEKNTRYWNLQNCFEYQRS
jgi:hypothetical protein